MVSKLEAVRRALYPCFPDQAQTDINTLIDTDQSINYAMSAFQPEEVSERAMLVALHHTATTPVTGFLWITNSRLLFVAAIKALRQSHPFYREIPYTSVLQVFYDKSRWFQVAKITLRVDGTPEAFIFESIVKPQPLQHFVDYLQNKVTNPEVPVPPDDEDFITGLERLTRLNSQGVFAEGEFEAAKKKLLGG